MRIHHLNCATMCPISARLVNGEPGWLKPARMVAHCLLIESNDGLVLVDTGIGTLDVASPRERLGAEFTYLTRPRLLLEETAAHQVERLGFRRDEVRHIVVTHLDLDHAGGLGDFPQAQVHVFERERVAALQPSSFNERQRYKQWHWSHGPRWKDHRVEGERWFGFDAVRAIPHVGPDVLLVPLHGHTQGHCGVAVRGSGGWLLHCGDAYFFRGEMDAKDPYCTPGLAIFQRVLAVDNDERVRNQARLRELAARHASEVRLFSAHDGWEFDRLASALPPNTTAQPMPALAS